MSQIAFPYHQTKLTRKEALQKGIIPIEFQGDCAVYLLHFSGPIGSRKHQAQHYIGIVKEATDARIQRRINQHKRGNKKNCSKITAAARDQRRKIKKGMVWKGVNAEFEKYLKSWKCSKEFCPCCQKLPFF